MIVRNEFKRRMPALSLASLLAFAALDSHGLADGVFTVKCVGTTLKSTEDICEHGDHVIDREEYPGKWTKYITIDSLNKRYFTVEYNVASQPYRLDGMNSDEIWLNMYKDGYYMDSERLDRNSGAYSAFRRVPAQGGVSLCQRVTIHVSTGMCELTELIPFTKARKAKKKDGKQF